MSNKAEIVRISELTLVKKTEKAILVRQQKIETWIPQSQISYMLTQDGLVTIEIPEWLAYKTKLDY